MNLREACVAVRVLSLRLAVSLLATACGDPATSPDAQSEPAEQPLYVAPNLWPGGVVPVCFPGGVPPGDARPQLIRWYLEDTWASVANVRFAFGPCESLLGTSHVEVTYITGRAHATGHGPATGGALQVRLPMFEQLDPVRDRSFVRNAIVHEFGHVLGFIHEQQRPDFVADPGCAPRADDMPSWTPIPGGKTLTPLDRNSMMSYCDGFVQNLTPLDRAGAAAAYGPLRAPPRTAGRSLAWQAADGRVQVWLMGAQGAILASAGPVQPPPAGWRVVGAADFSGDGLGDLLWRNEAAGLTQVWAMNSGSTDGSLALRDPGNGWFVAGTGMFDDDAFADVLWGSRSGALAITYTANPGVVTNVGSLGAGWTFGGVGQFDRDRRSDVLMRDAAGNLLIWAGGSNNPPVAAGQGAPAGWVLTGLGDFDGDGQSDIVWRSPAGDVIVQRWIGGSTTRIVGRLGSEWTMIGTADLDADGQSDILWRSSAGRLVMWRSGLGEQSADLGTVSRDLTFAGTLLDRMF